MKTNTRIPGGLSPIPAKHFPKQEVPPHSSIQKNQKNSVFESNNPDSHDNQPQNAKKKLGVSVGFLLSPGFLSIQVMRDDLEYYMPVLKKAFLGKYSKENLSWVRNFRENFIQNFQSLHYTKSLKPADPRVIASKKVPLPRKPKDQSKLK